jgi:3-oxoacyl-[acyl-carrier-protein] synthase II
VDNLERVVITGMGVISPLGNNLNDFWANVKKGKCGIDYIKAFDTKDFDVKVAGEVKDFNPKDYLSPKEAKRLDKFCQFAIAGADMAVKDSGLCLDKIDKTRFGVIVGSGVGGIETIEEEARVIREKGPRRVKPLFVPMIIINMVAGNLAIRYGAKGICTSIVTACATGNNAIGEAFRTVKNNYADVMIAGGSEASITPLAMAGFTNLTALSKSTDVNRASIPFDKERSGFVMGEGAGILILESLSHAQKRGAKIYAEIVGYGSTCDAYHMTSPDPSGEQAANAMKLAIKEGNVEKEQISYINAHGTSTPYNDKFETLAIKNVFKEYAYKIPVSSTKSMTGHLLGAAGAVEAIICVKALEEGFIPPTINYKQKDEDCDLDYVPNEGREAQLKCVLSNSFGFGGHNAVLLFKKF